MKKLLPGTGVMVILALVCRSQGISAQPQNPGSRPHRQSDGQNASPKSSKSLLPPISVQRLADAARFLAGLNVGDQSDFFDLTQTNAWKKFAGRTEARWRGFALRTAKMRDWARAEVWPVYAPGSPVFYPFSGPDFIFTDIFLPEARQYILAGLENVGSVPRRESLSTQDLELELALALKAVDDLIDLSFFRTNDMKEDLVDPMMNGVVPVILMLLARLDAVIISVESGNLNAEGQFAAEPEGSPERKTVAVIRFRKPGDVEARTVTYFSVNLYDGDLQKNPSFGKFVQRELPRCFTFLKSASYLMHHVFFSSIRSMILDRSYAVLQDDSGVPYKFFAKDAWAVTLYGKYDGPIKLFKDNVEEDLREAYKGDVKPLDFRIGYAVPSNLALAVKKWEGAQPVVPAGSWARSRALSPPKNVKGRAFGSPLARGLKSTGEYCGNGSPGKPGAPAAVGPKADASPPRDHPSSPGGRIILDRCPDNP